MAHTLIMVKPDAVQNNYIGQILARFEANDLKIRQCTLTQLALEDAQRFYAVHAERPFYGELVEFMTSGPVVACVLEGGDDVITKVRTLMGATDPAEADAGTIRKDFAENKGRNAVHGSDAPETAQQEIEFFTKLLGWKMGAAAAR